MHARATVFLFGAAERGEFCTPLYLQTLEQLWETLGHPPENSEGIECAIQSLLFQHSLIYYRVAEEGFERDDYMRGLKFLKQNSRDLSLQAVCMPGVSDHEIIQAATTLCHVYGSILLFSEKDFYDYLTVK